MKKVNWAQANEIYILHGHSCARNLFMKDKRCHQIFITNLNRFVSKVGTILNYKVNEYGWAILIKTHEEKAIKEAYLAQRNKSKKANRDCDLEEVKRMISEFVRYFLSSTALQCNDHLGRKGVLVQKRFQKLWISNQAEYGKAFDAICRLQDFEKHQRKEYYQPPMDKYESEGIEFDGLLRCGVGHYRSVSCDGCWVDGLVQVYVMRPGGDVLRQFFQNNKNNQIPPPET